MQEVSDLKVPHAREVIIAVEVEHELRLWDVVEDGWLESMGERDVSFGFVCEGSLPSDSGSGSFPFGGFFPPGKLPFEEEPEGGQLPIFIPNILKQGTFASGILISILGSLGNLKPGGGPGTTFQRAIGKDSPGGLMTGITVAFDDP